ncbi:glycoside hydrolase family 13 protein [Uliginosibacterium gangwonense]|uniref:glycoside hydrolase family 13 protein n=1 Tax=Uliginosibacterium gangwonense TaxID=392736 RepID=UPI000380E1CB|nr:glycoside hydrolase family 13 protein [Uliginosibacterium gangwonense]
MDRRAEVVYQIFPERFAIGAPHTSASKLALPMYQAKGNATRAWHEMPAMRPKEARDRGHIFYGGDLAGVIDKLDYLQDLGVTTLYFTPIFKAPSNHKYDAVDFFTVDPMFGDEKTLRRLIAELDRRGMGLILDAVLNHVNYRNPWFLAAKRGELPYKDWFSFDAKGRHECWWGNEYLAELNLENEALQDILFKGPKSFLAHYLEMGIKGWRFDTAQDLGLKTACRIHDAIIPRFPESQLLGELITYAGGWLDGSGFTGMMNYYFREAMLAWLAGDISHRQAAMAMQDYYQGYGHEGALKSWLMLSSHDTMRLRTAIPDPKLRQLAIAAQFTLPGIPLIYYGEENGMEGADDPDCRRAMIWDEAQWEVPMREFVRKMVELRHALPALQHGSLTMLSDRQDSNALIFVRQTDVLGEFVFVVINLSRKPLKELVFVPCPHLYSSVPLRDLMDPEREAVKMGGGCVWLEAPASGVAVYAPFEPYDNYRFFKPRNQAGV